MCGIIGIISEQEVATRLIEGLQRLEYRGYDSAGIATISQGKIHTLKVKGKIANLAEAAQQNPVIGGIGIGHTRWATHGIPSVNNAHPHQTDQVAVVHNGIIENFRTIKAELEQQGMEFITETDTEVIPKLITWYLNQGLSPFEAARESVKRFEGAFAIAAIFKDQNGLIIAARKGAPLAIGYGQGEMYLGSDACALCNLTDQIAYLEEGDIAELTANSANIYQYQNKKIVQRAIKTVRLNDAVGKGNYRHFMLKEIYEQPSVLADTLAAYFDQINNQIYLPEFTVDFVKVPKITIVACGTSFFAGVIAKYWFESVAHIEVEVEIASEFRYRNICLPAGGIALFISQSGETADTLAALRFAKQHKQHIISVVNVVESSMAREADYVLETFAGPEIGVASTKAFTAQLMTLACLAIYSGNERKALSKEDSNKLIAALMAVPGMVATLLLQEEIIKELAKELAKASNVLYTGRGTSYPIAQEGALKLKELSYIHAEAIAAGELKHGTIALIDENMPVIAIAPHDKLVEKTSSNIQEVAARGGKIILISTRENNQLLQSLCFKSLIMPEADPFITPLLYAIPVQLLAYHTAVYKGTDVDQPRNLAKSVTVE
jgi:glucosamine--fructose-6-phosphate aminotransferase (isomerizing)